MDKCDEQLCWSCKNATGGCSWSKSFIPVDGWEATPTLLDDRVESFKINACPEYREEDVKLITFKELSNIVNINISTLLNMKLNKLKKTVNEQGFELLFFFDEEDPTKVGIKKITPPFQNLKTG